MALSEMYDKAWKMILSPEPFRHKPIEFGPKERSIGDWRIRRTDIKVKNTRGRQIQGFVFSDTSSQAQQLVLYLHGSGGSKLDALDFLSIMPKYGLAVAAMDFAGCGNSEHQLLTYGHRQAEDVKIFLDEVNRTVRARSVTIWGRSMGAVTAIIFAHRYGEMVQGLILDGPFQRLEQVIERLVCSHAPNIPRAVVSGFVCLLKWKVNSQLKLGHCLFEVDYVKLVSQLDRRIAMLLIYSNYDELVPTEEALEFYKMFPGQVKQTYEIFQGHSQQRQVEMYEEAIKWMKRSKPVYKKRRSVAKSTVNLVGSNMLDWKDSLSDDTRSIRTRRTEATYR